MINLNQTIELTVEVANGELEQKTYGAAQPIAGEVVEQDDQLSTILCDNGWVLHNVPNDCFDAVQVEKNRAIA